MPEWMRQEENYVPQTDRDGFLTKSTLTVLGTLSKFRRSGTSSALYAKLPACSPPLKLLLTICFIALISMSRNMMFSYTMAGGVLFAVCLLPGKQLRQVFLPAAGAALLTGCILIPGVFLGAAHTLLTVSIKVFLSVALVGLLSATTPWNKLTAGLRFYHVPDLFIFTLDITLKYIVILGDLCVEMLQALRIRSVGYNKSKGRALSGVLGVTYLKSRQMAEEMSGAMACRGFEGEYRRECVQGLTGGDVLYILLLLAVIGLFVWFQMSMGGA